MRLGNSVSLQHNSLDRILSCCDVSQLCAGCDPCKTDSGCGLQGLLERGCIVAGSTDLQDLCDVFPFSLLISLRHAVPFGGVLKMGSWQPKASQERNILKNQLATVPSC